MVKTRSADIVARAMLAAKTALLAALCAIGVARLVRWLSRRPFPGGARVLYCHDVLPADGGCRSAPGSLNARELERRLVHIWRCYGFITVDELLNRIAAGEPPAGTPAVLTFDDGYRSFLTEVYPILRRHGIPAALFVATGTVGGAGLWTDEVRSAVERAAANGLSLRLCGREVRLDGRAGCAEAAEDLIEELKRLPDAARRRAARRLCADAGPSSALDGGMLSWDELRTLSRDPLLTLGAHTVSHPVLARMEDDQAKREIALSRSELQRELGVSATAFSYPNGASGDFTEAHQRMVADAGFRAAFSTIPGLALPGGDVCALPRTCLAREPWPRFVLRMAGLDDLIAYARSARRRGRGPKQAAPAEAPLPLPRAAGNPRRV